MTEAERLEAFKEVLSMPRARLCVSRDVFKRLLELSQPGGPLRLPAGLLIVCSETAPEGYMVAMAPVRRAA